MTIRKATAVLPGRPVHDGAPAAVEERELSVDGFSFVSRAVTHTAQPVTEPFVLLGGSSQDRFSWARNEKQLAPLSAVVTVDLPGYGAADFLPAEHGISFLADALRHTLDELGLDRVNLVGTCFGGAVALRFAQRHPGRVQRLVMISMTRDLPGDLADGIARWLRLLDQGRTEDIARELVERFMAPGGAGLVQRHAAVSRLLYRQFTTRTDEQIRLDVEHNLRLMSHDWYAPGPVPPIPGLVVTGEHDSLTPPHMGRQAAECLSGAWFTTVKEADHLAPVERAAEVGDLIARFCTDRSIDPLPYCNAVEFVPGPPAPLPAARAVPSDPPTVAASA